MTTGSYGIDLPALHTLEIERDCFQNTEVFVLDNLPCLETVQIGSNSFALKREGNNNNSSSCRITNCPNLQELNIPCSCFTGFRTFELSNVDSLKLINMGDNTFIQADLVLKGRKWLLLKVM